jgi:hypothetical protein
MNKPQEGVLPYRAILPSIIGGIGLAAIRDELRRRERRADIFQPQNL